MTRALAVLLAAAMLSSCATARRRELTAPLPLNAETSRGERVFAAHCDKCHPGGEGGLAPALNNKAVPEVIKRFQVRHGLGAMPSFPEEVIPKSDLDALMDYLGTLRRAR